MILRFCLKIFNCGPILPIFGLEKLIERNYQEKSKRLQDYGDDANELMGTGPQTKGSPYKNVDLKGQKYKSAPPGAPGGGWGALEEEKEEKPQKKIKIKIKTELDEKKRKKKTKKKRKSKKKSGTGGYYPYWDMFDGGSSGDSGGDGGGGGE